MILRQTENDPVTLLRSQVDLSPYFFPVGSPDWLLGLNKLLADDLGILAILGRSGLNVAQTEGRRVFPDSLSLGISAFTDLLRGKGRRIAVGLPPGARHLPLLLAAVSVLADALRKAQSTAGVVQSACMPGVLIVSTDLDVRSRYCDLRVKNETLDSVYPGSRMKPSGEVVALNAAHTNGLGKGVCFLLPGQKLPAPNVRVGFAVLDLRYARLSKRVKNIAQWACALHKQTEVVALYTLGDRDTLEALTKQNFEVFPVDHSACAVCSKLMPGNSPTYGALDWNILRNPNYLEREHDVISIEDETLETSLSTARKMIDDQRVEENFGLNRARWIAATLTQMPTPLVWYEQAARNLGRSTLRRTIDLFGFKHDPGMGSTMQSLKMQFEAILGQIQCSNPRAAKFLETLPGLVQDAGEVLILVRDDISRRALQNWFDVEAFPNAAWLRNVSICACSDYSSIALKKFPLVIVNGSFPRRYRWIAGAALGDTVNFMAFPSEVSVIESQLKEVYSAPAIEARAVQRRRVLGVPPSSKTDPPPFKLIFNKPKKSENGSKKESSSPFMSTIKSLADIGKTFEAAKTVFSRNQEDEKKKQELKQTSWEDTATDEASEISDADDALPSHTDDLNCLQFKIMSKQRGKGFLWLQPNQIVECVRSSTPDAVSRLTAREIKVGDHIVLVQEDARGGLFERVVELAEDQPELQYLASYRKQWGEAIRCLAIKYNCEHRGFTKLLNDFRGAGSTISTEISIGNWVSGRVMGPDDVSSIRAAGELAGIQSLQREAGDFDKAFRQIRALHQTLGRKLTRLIKQSSRYLVDDENSSEQDSLGDHIWLPVNELLETVDVAEVLSVNSEMQSTPPYKVGRLVPD